MTEEPLLSCLPQCPVLKFNVLPFVDYTFTYLKRQAPVMPTATGGRTGARCSNPPPSVSSDKDAGAAVAAVTALPPSQLDTVMEDHDPFDELSAAEGTIFADASVRRCYC